MAGKDLCNHQVQPCCIAQPYSPLHPAQATALFSFLLISATSPHICSFLLNLKKDNPVLLLPALPWIPSRGSPLLQHPACLYPASCTRQSISPCKQSSRLLPPWGTTCCWANASHPPIPKTPKTRAQRSTPRGAARTHLAASSASSSHWRGPQTWGRSRWSCCPARPSPWCSRCAAWTPWWGTRRCWARGTRSAPWCGPTWQSAQRPHQSFPAPKCS